MTDLVPSFRSLDLSTQQEIAAADLAAFKATAPGTDQHMDVAQQIALYSSRYDAYSAVVAPSLPQVRELLLANHVPEQGFLALLDGTKAHAIRYQAADARYAERAATKGMARELATITQYTLRLLDDRGAQLQQTASAPAHSLRVLIGWDNAAALDARIGVDRATKQTASISPLAKTTTFVGELAGRQLFTGLVPSPAQIARAIADHVQIARAEAQGHSLVSPSSPGALRFAHEKTTELYGPQAKVFAPAAQRHYSGVLAYMNNAIALQLREPGRTVVHDVHRLTGTDPTQFHQLVTAMEKGELLNIQYGARHEPAQVQIVRHDVAKSQNQQEGGKGAEVA